MVSFLGTHLNFKYLRHFGIDDLKDEVHIKLERTALAFRCNTLARRFALYDAPIKLKLLRAYKVSQRTQIAVCELHAAFPGLIHNIEKPEYMVFLADGKYSADIPSYQSVKI